MENKQFEDEWLRIVIGLFKKIQPGFRSDMEWRAELYCQMYSLTFECLQRNLSMLTAFLDSRTASSGFDIINMLQVMAYFELHDLVVTYIDGLHVKIDRVRATEGIFQRTNLMKHFSAYEESIKACHPEPSHLKMIRDAL